MVIHSRSIPVVYPLVALYLIAIVAANLLVAAFGPSVVVINALVLVALDLTARDSLHDAWRGPSLWWKMAALIACGSLLSYALSIRTGPIALASFLAFAASGAADALVYHGLRERARLVRVNGSNVVSALVDSALFLSLLAALSGLPWGVVPVLVLGQWAAKVAGGFLWSIVLEYVRR